MGAMRAPEAATGSAGTPWGFGPRRVAVLELAAAGLTDREIAARLGVAHSTVRQRLDECAALCGVRGRTGAVAVWLLSEGCTPAQRALLRARLRLPAWAR
jgi:DNA-binding NarL/FixJ family response regulator